MEAFAAAMILNLIKSALKNKIFWYLVSRYLTFGIQFISSIYIAVKLGAYYFGIWSFVLLLINIGNQFNWGIGNALNIIYVQNKNDQIKCRCYCFNAMLLTFLIMIPVILFTLYERIFGIVYFQKYQLGNMIYGVALVICLNYVNTLLMNISRVKGHVFAIAFNQSVFPVLTLILMFCMNGITLLHFLLVSYVVAMLLSILLYCLEGEAGWFGSLDSALMREIWRKGIYLFFYNACFYLIALSTKLIISYHYSVEDFGYFAFAFGLANAVMMLIDSLTFLAFPKMIDMLCRKDNAVILEKINFLRQYYTTAIGGIVYAAIPCCYFLLYFIPKYRCVFPYFTLILLVLAIYSSCYGHNTYLLANNREQILAVCSGLALILNIFLTILFSSYFHLNLASCLLGFLISYLFYTLSISFCSTRILSNKNRFYNWIKTVPFCFLLPLVLTIILLFMKSIMLIWLPGLIFCILYLKIFYRLAKTGISLINNPDLINIRTFK